MQTARKLASVGICMFVLGLVGCSDPDPKAQAMEQETEKKMRAAQDQAATAKEAQEYSERVHARNEERLR